MQIDNDQIELEKDDEMTMDTIIYSVMKTEA